MAEAADATPPAAVIVQRVGRQCFVRTIHATGYVVPRETALVMFNAPDFRISEVLVKPGDTVGRNAVVARALSTAARSGNAAPASVDIHAPVSGLILASDIFVGQPTSLTAGPLFTLAVDGDIEASIEIPGLRVFDLKSGQVVQVDMRDDTIVPGHVRLSPSIIKEATQMGEARVAFDTKPARAVVGRFIRATVEADRSCNVGVPQAALVDSSNGPHLQVIERGVVATRAVRLGLQDNLSVEVLDGLREGDLIVANAGAALRDGDRVTAVAANGQDLP